MPCLFSFDAEWHNFLLPQTALSWFLISRLNHLWVTQVKMQKKQNTNLVFSKPYRHTQNRSCEWVPGLLTHIPMSAAPELVAYVPKNKRLSFGRFPTPFLCSSPTFSLLSRCWKNKTPLQSVPACMNWRRAWSYMLSDAVAVWTSVSVFWQSSNGLPWPMQRVFCDPISPPEGFNRIFFYF